MRLAAISNCLFGKGKRQKLTMLAAGFVVYVLLLSGIFAYFHSEDSVANRLKSKNGSVTIQELNWDSSGQYKARASEPGMRIEKDPSGYNEGQADLYIRLKMTITLAEFDETNKSQTYIDNYKDNFDSETEAAVTNAERTARRLESIVNQIKLVDGTQFITLNKQDNETNVSEWKIAACNNDNFQIELNAANNLKTGNQLEFYFYYTGGDKNADNEDIMRIVQPKESTEELFDYIDIPIYKKDYLGVFDQKYTITLEAEGIPAANYPNGLTVADAIGTTELPSPFEE
jgi:hypothetical protein